MLKLMISALMLFAVGTHARADDLITVKSAKPVKETLDRLQKLVSDEGFIIVGRVPHSDAAKGAGLTLRPTELMIFGEPQSGTPLMVCDQRAGIDVPLRALAWQDQAGQVWLGMVDPQALKKRYALGPDCDGVIARWVRPLRSSLPARPRLSDASWARPQAAFT